jgi:hypothetical protein
MSRVFWPAAIPVLLSGCAVYDTGQVDYRRVTAGSASAQPNSAVKNPCAQPCSLKQAFKNSALGSEIDSGDVFSISIDHGLIADMVEPKFAVRRAVQLRDPFRRVGEIVILASVFEFDAGTTATRGFVDFSDLTDAKVIYYNPDVEENQHLNFSNIPLLAPSEYGGRPVGVQIFIIELDRMSKPMRGLLTQLADLGWASNLMPTGAGGALLMKLGKSMLAGAHDDTIFEYRFVLDPVGTTHQAPLLESGRYVLVRGQERRNSFDWGSVKLSSETGELLCVSVAGCTEGEPYNGATYLVLNIKKHPDGVTSSIAQQNYGDLLTAIDKAADDRDASLTEVTAQINALTEGAGTKALIGRLEREIAATKAAADTYQRSLVPSGASGCARAQSAEADLQAQAATLFDGVSAVESELDAAATRNLLARTARLFMPMSQGPGLGDFIDLATFQAKFGSAAGFSSELINAVKSRAPAGGCSTLVPKRA